MVSMADGHHKFIEDVIAGDRVLSLSGTDLVDDEVVGSWPAGIKKTVCLNGNINTTPDHRFFTDYAGCKRIDSCESVMTATAGQIGIEPVETVVDFRELPTYDIETKAHHNFVANGYIVHNSGKDKTFINFTVKEAVKRKGLYAYLFPNYNQGRKVIWDGMDKSGFPFMHHFPGFENPKSPESIVSKVNNTTMSVRLKTGSKFQVFGTDDIDCYDEKTEILTDDGWKFFKDIKDTEVVATRVDGNMVFEKINSRVEYDYSGDMFRLKNSVLDMLVTPNHKFFVKSRKNIYKFKEISDPTILNDMIPSDSGWVGVDQSEFILPKIPKVSYRCGRGVGHVMEADWNLKFKTEDWCAFLGIYLAEGSTYCVPKKGEYRVYVSQKKELVSARIIELLNRMGLNYCYDGFNFQINNKQLYEYLRPIGDCYSKYIPPEIKNLSTKYLKILKEWMILGDGCSSPKCNEVYYSVSKRLVDDFQEVILKLGYSGNVTEKVQSSSSICGREIKSLATLYQCIIRKSSYKYFRTPSKGSSISREHYSGKVYCVDVGSHVIKVRRNGKEIWCGNSIRGINPGGCVFSEYSYQVQGAWDDIRPILRENDGWSIFNWTPHGRNFAYEMEVMARGNKKWFFQSLTVDDTKKPDGTPVVTASEIQEDRDEGMSEAMALQEYYNSYDAQLETCFFGDSLARHKSYENGIRGELDSFKLDWTNETRTTEIKWVPEAKGILEVWDLPYRFDPKWNSLEWKKRYSIGSDIGEGLGQDYSVAYVYDRLIRKIVARMRSNKIDAHQWADYLDQLSLFYDGCIIVPERTGAGITTCKRLWDLRSNVYYNMIAAKAGKATSRVVGWVETKQAKWDMCGDFREHLKTADILVQDAILLQECSVFVIKENKKIEAEDGFHDDCLKSGTLVKTIDGYVPIEDVVSGDLVLTHMNRYKRVTKSIEKDFSGDWYDMKFQCQLPLGLSANHPVYTGVLNCSRKIKYPDFSKRKWTLPGSWKKKYRCVSLIEGLGENKNITLKEDMFYKNGKHANSNKVVEIKADREFAEFLGLFLAEGHAGRSHDRDYRCSFAFNKYDTTLIKKIKDYLIKIGVAVEERHYGSSSGAFALGFSSKFLHSILTECYDKNREKKLPFYARFLGRDLESVLEYWLRGDGWINNDDYIGATTSKALGLAMRDIAFSCGSYATIQRVKRHRYEVVTKDQYWVKIAPWSKTSHQRKISDFEYGSRISGVEGAPKITKSNFSGKVYNLQVEDDESFVADGIVVHNCCIAACLAIQGGYYLGVTPKQTGEQKMKEKAKKKALDSLDPASRSAVMEYNDLLEREAGEQGLGNDIFF